MTTSIWSMASGIPFLVANAYSTDRSTGESSPSPRPSSRLLDSLLTLGSGIQDLGIHSDSTRLSLLTMQALHRFVVSLTKHLDINTAKGIPTSVSWDLTFLLLLVESWGPESRKIQSLLLDHVAPSSEVSCIVPDDPESLFQSDE